MANGLKKMKTQLLNFGKGGKEGTCPSCGHQGLIMPKTGFNKLYLLLLIPLFSMGLFFFTAFMGLLLAFSPKLIVLLGAAYFIHKKLFKKFQCPSCQWSGKPQTFSIEK